MPSPAPARGPRKRKIGSAYTGPAEAERSLPPKRTRLPAPLPPAGPSTPGWAWEGQQAPAADAPPAGPEPEQRDAATLAGWATRRRHFAASWARLADLSSADASLLPSDDLLNALHAHTAALYASHGLLAPVGSKTRKYTYLSRKKRALLVEGVLARPGPKASKRESTRSLYKRREMRACFEGNALLALGGFVGGPR
ncbi:hypothetical protein Q8F55_006338 [Vanrija albida]|uniref:Uncharacterized protein n=1 Tax=Vanrija albida TaxID=181172 RepID=A0ABR3PWV4_9TREE